MHFAKPMHVTILTSVLDYLFYDVVATAAFQTTYTWP